MLLTELIDKLNDAVKGLTGLVVAGSHTDYKCDITFDALHRMIGTRINNILYPLGLTYGIGVVPITDSKVLPVHKRIDLPVNTIILHLHKDAKYYKVSFAKMKLHKITFVVPDHATGLALNMEAVTVEEYITMLLDRDYLAQIDRLNTELYADEENLQRKRTYRDEIMMKRGALRPVKSRPFTCTANLSGGMPDVC